MFHFIMTDCKEVEVLFFHSFDYSAAIIAHNLHAPRRTHIQAKNREHKELV